MTMDSALPVAAAIRGVDVERVFAGQDFKCFSWSQPTNTD